VLIDSIRCEVLNASYDPLSVVSGRRALVLCLKGKASVVAEHPEFSISSAGDIYPIPTQILLKEMVKSGRKTRTTAQLTQRNLFVRDKYTCQYCNRHRTELKHGEFLTRDHIHPQSKGGKDTWTNLTTACITCNNKKANLHLDEFQMKLLKEPTTPTVFEIQMKASIERARRRTQ
jgi:5-methylcytosine-specific restriction endonuclease McrA